MFYLFTIGGSSIVMMNYKYQQTWYFKNSPVHLDVEKLTIHSKNKCILWLVHQHTYYNKHLFRNLGEATSTYILHRNTAIFIPAHFYCCIPIHTMHLYTHWFMIALCMPLTLTKSSSLEKHQIFGMGVWDLGNEFHPKIVLAKSNSSMIVFKTIMPWMKDNRCPS